MALSPALTHRPQLLQWGRRATDSTLELETELQSLYDACRSGEPEGRLQLIARGIARTARTRHIPSAVLSHSLRYTLLVSERMTEAASFRIVRAACEAYREARVD
jgi:hypothetical protein